MFTFVSLHVTEAIFRCHLALKLKGTLNVICAHTLVIISHNKTNKCTNVKITFLHKCIANVILIEVCIVGVNAVSINPGPCMGSL